MPNRVRRHVLVLLSVIALCPACASMATQGKVSRSALPLGVHSAPTVRRVFASRVTAADLRPTVVPTVGASAAWGTVRLVINDDDTFEYLATIYNPRGETFTSAFLRREGGDDESGVVATLFSDLTLRSQYIQLRGTVSIGRNGRAGVLAEELRENPRAFAISVHTPSSPQKGAIRGAIE